MSRRAVAVAGGLVAVGLLFWGWRVLRPRAPAAVTPAPRCGFPVELAGGRGIACWDGRAVAANVRPGDRVDEAGRPVGRMTPEALAAYEVAIDPNRADAAELTALPGVGPALARKIVEERVRGGRFRSVDDLLRVSGIGEKTLARVRARVRVEP
ncbi:MAG TPA: ComEA family DNA-binding protein [Polyangia bacterium]|nr:ComEA family DNA-binding protein [Polyangia bacterium]